MFWLLEGNSTAMEGLSIQGQWPAAFFQSASARTAGFNGVDLSSVQQPRIIGDDH